MTIHYFDHHTATPPLPFKHPPLWLPLNTLYTDRSTQALSEKAAQVIQKNLPGEMIVTSDGAEAVAAAIMGHYRHEILSTGRNHVLYFASEEAPIMHMMDMMPGLSCHPKATTEKELKKDINPRVSLLCFSLADGLTGQIRPIHRIARLCQEHDIRIHVDITTAFGRIDTDGLPADYITLDGHLIQAPTSCGLLVAKNALPEYVPGRSPNLERLLALQVAFEHAQKHRIEQAIELAHRREHFEKHIRTILPNVKVLFDDQERLPNVSCLDFPGVKNELLLFHLTRQNIFPSIGGGRMQLLQHYISSSALSFVFSSAHTLDAIDHVVSCIKRVYSELQLLWSDQ